MTDDRREDRPPTATERILAVAAKLTGRAGRSERVERVLLAVAVAVFAVAIVWAWRELPDERRELQPGWLTVVLVLGLLSVWLNALEFRLSARILGRSLPGGVALQVSVMGSAANVLPIPGAAVIRSRALHQLGERARPAIIVTVAIGIAWVASAALLAGVVLLAAVPEVWILGVSFLAAALTGMAAVIGLIHLEKRRAAGLHLLGLLGVEIASVTASSLRLFAVAMATGFRVTLPDAVTINLGGILSHAAGIFPGGLGIRELTSGIFASLVGVPTSVGVLLAAMDRLATYLVLAAVALPLLRPWRRPIRTGANDETVSSDRFPRHWA